MLLVNIAVCFVDTKTHFKDIRAGLLNVWQESPLRELWEYVNDEWLLDVKHGVGENCPLEFSENSDIPF